MGFRTHDPQLDKVVLHCGGQGRRRANDDLCNFVLRLPREQFVDLLTIIAERLAVVSQFAFIALAGVEMPRL